MSVGVVEAAPLSEPQALIIVLLLVSLTATLALALALRHLKEREHIKELALKERAMTDVALAAERRERARIAADLHDDLVQVLTATLMQLDVVKRSPLPPNAELSLDRATTMLRMGMDRARHLMFDLKPGSLDEGGIDSAIRELLDEPIFEGVEKILDLTPERFAPPVESLIYRTVSECLHNAIKHSSCSHVLVDVGCRDNRVYAKVSDNGNGFNTDMVNRLERGGFHLGLANMVERIERAGGRVDISSTTGMGTLVSFWLPFLPRVSELLDDSRLASRGSRRLPTV